MHGSEAPSGWVQRWSHLVPPGGAVLDVACGRGRHLRWFAQRGHPVTGVDRDPEAMAAIEGVGRAVLADIENGPWPFAGERFAGVVVTNYLWRALMPQIVDSVADSGNVMHRHFCPQCGTHLFSASEARPHLIIVRNGTLDDTTLARPDATIWTRSAPDWAWIDEALPRHEGQPPPVA